MSDGGNVLEVKIEVKKITKSFKDMCVLNGIDVTFESGHVYGIVGRNGSGKSVFLNILLGFIRQSSGEIKFRKNNVEYKPQMVAILDGSNLYSDLSAKENLIYLSKFRNLVEERDIERVLAKVGLNPNNKASIKKYSTGMRKRLLIAQAIMEPSDIVIMDEPTNGLDDNGVEVLYEIIAEMKRSGIIIIIASHNKEDITSICDCVYRMKGGKLWQENMD